MHGISLNVSNDLDIFTHIDACGFENLKTTSIEKRLSRNYSIEETNQLIIDAFSRVFECKMENISLNEAIKMSSLHTDIESGWLKDQD